MDFPAVPGDDAHVPYRDAVDLLALARRWANRRQDWLFEPQFDAESRWYRRLAEHPDCEIWLLTWTPGQHTEIHDHGGSAGAFTVASGQLTELTAHNRGRELRPRLLDCGEGRRFGPRHIHQVANHSQTPTVSVHVYSPALTTMNRYEASDAGLRLADVAEAGAQW